MKTSESIVNLTKALIKAQASMGAAVKGAKNPFYNSKYADYNSVLEVVKGPLNDNCIILLQPTIIRENKTFVETILIHAESGELISSELEVTPTKERDPQSYGSAITYARRYSLQSLLSIPAEDDDAERAMSRSAPTMDSPTVFEKVAKFQVKHAAPETKTPPVAPKAKVSSGDEW